MIAPDMVPSILGFLGVQVGSLGLRCIFNASEPYLVTNHFMLFLLVLIAKISKERCRTLVRAAQPFISAIEPCGVQEEPLLSFAPEKLRPNTWGPAAGLYRQSQR